MGQVKQEVEAGAVEIGGKVLLFDGVCNLCNGFVQWVIKRDPAGKFQFGPLQSSTSQALLAQAGWSGKLLDSFVYIRDGVAYDRSDAALRAISDLGGIYTVAKALLIFPRSVRNAVYNLIAKNRYRMFGKTESCMIPTPELRARFID